MKQFLKIDAYLQLALCTLAVILLPVAIFYADTLLSDTYMITGIAQLCSFLIRLVLRYPKSVWYKLYGGLMMPVWIILLLLFLRIPEISGIALNYIILYMMAALFFSPLMAVIYALDCRRVYKASTYKIQKFLHLVN